ncbi:unnamed protein product, partial [Meganyctiphanes norvegica]
NAIQNKSLQPVRMEMQVRLFSLLSHEVHSDSFFNTLESNFSEDHDQLSETEEDILEFHEIFEMFGYTTPEKIKKKYDALIISKRIPISKHFFVYAENKLMMDICNKLSENDVYQMYILLCASKDVENDERIKDLCACVLKLDENAIEKVKGLKEVAFFHLVLTLMRKNLLNRLYTHTLKFALKNLIEYNKVEGKEYSYISPLLDILDQYPLISRPTGLCIIFSVHKDRQGAEKDLLKVKNLFEKNFKYDVLVKIDPTAHDIKSITTKLSAARNKFYDSLVVFFMGHGSKSHLHVKNGTIHRRSDLIEPFTDIEWFFKKPKLFFIQACAVRSERRRTSSTSYSGGKGLGVDTDALGWKAPASKEWQTKFGDHTDFSHVNNFADTLISYATMWYQEAARSTEGSLYIDTLVDQLCEYGCRESIENVLRRVHYNVNTVSLSSAEHDLWKQAPYFESSLQKAFIFPKN